MLGFVLTQQVEVVAPLFFVERVQAAKVSLWDDHAVVRDYEVVPYMVREVVFYNHHRFIRLEYLLGFALAHITEDTLPFVCLFKSLVGRLVLWGSHVHRLEV